MESHEHELTKITEYRSLVEARLSALLKQAGSTLTLDKIKNLIFDSTQKQFKSYVEELLAIFESLESAVDIDAAVPVIQDAWNYFPHRFLNERSPAEVLLERD